MNETMPDIAKLTTRLDRLDRRDRRWKWGTIASLAAVACMGVAGLRAQNRGPQDASFGTVTFRRMALLDNGGRTILSIGTGETEPRAIIPSGEFKGAPYPWLPASWGRNDPAIWFWSQNGAPTAMIFPRGLVLYQKNSKGFPVMRSALSQSELDFFDLSQKSAILLGGTPPPNHPLTPQERFAREINDAIPATVAHSLLINGSSGEVVIGTDAGGPSVALSDPQGYKTQIGVTDLVLPSNGETRKTSAASIVMFGNDKRHKVIWQAPLP